MILNKTVYCFRKKPTQYLKFALKGFHFCSSNMVDILPTRCSVKHQTVNQLLVCTHLDSHNYR